MSSLREINENEFDEIVQNNRLVFVDFFASWCPPCRNLIPVLEEVSEKLKDEVVFVKLNVDENDNIAQKFRIMNIPALFLFKDGEQVESEVGYRDVNGIMDMIKSHLKD